jgi:hypothetical protein
MTIGITVSMEMPGIASYIGLALMNIIYFDLFFTDSWIPDAYNLIDIDFNSESDEEPLN